MENLFIGQCHYYLFSYTLHLFSLSTKCSKHKFSRFFSFIVIFVERLAIKILNRTYVKLNHHIVGLEKYIV